MREENSLSCSLKRIESVQKDPRRTLQANCLITRFERLTTHN